VEPAVELAAGDELEDEVASVHVGERREASQRERVVQRP